MTKKTNDPERLTADARPQDSRLMVFLNYFSEREQWLVPFFFILTAAFTAFDIISDIHEGEELSHLFIEMIIAGISVLGSLIFVLKFKNMKKALNLEFVRSKTAELEAATWKDKNQKLTKDLSSAINEQFLSWGLTPAERDVALFLLKGFSTAEISNLRSASEKTVKQQCSHIYAKAGLTGRTELSAFFLEDIMLGIENTEKH